MSNVVKLNVYCVHVLETVHIVLWLCHRRHRPNHRRAPNIINIFSKQLSFRFHCNVCTHTHHTHTHRNYIHSKKKKSGNPRNALSHLSTNRANEDVKSIIENNNNEKNVTHNCKMSRENENERRRRGEGIPEDTASTAIASIHFRSTFIKICNSRRRQRKNEMNEKITGSHRTRNDDVYV